MITVLLIIHGLVAVALLGAVTHQSFSVVTRSAAAKKSFVDRFRGVNAAAFTNTIIILFLVSTALGASLYPQYRIDVRTTLEDLQLRAANGIFEIKEHFAAIGVGMLPVYWLAWRAPLAADYASSRKYLTWLLAFIVWWNFLTGHILNNIKGLL